MIWEEGKFACSLYPRDKPFLDSITTEVTDQVSYHARTIHPLYIRL